MCSCKTNHCWMADLDNQVKVVLMACQLSLPIQHAMPRWKSEFVHSDKRMRLERLYWNKGNWYFLQVSLSLQRVFAMGCGLECWSCQPTTCWQLQRPWLWWDHMQAFDFNIPYTPPRLLTKRSSWMSSFETQMSMNINLGQCKKYIYIFFFYIERSDYSCHLYPYSRPQHDCWLRINLLSWTTSHNW